MSKSFTLCWCIKSQLNNYSFQFEGRNFNFSNGPTKKFDGHKLGSRGGCLIMHNVEEILRITDFRKCRLMLDKSHKCKCIVILVRKNVILIVTNAL